ncbi:uncharacterized protein LOC118751298 [Rhagoletis pomonella]|uniref:uncharacterized protein LOC118751298 n=1 Tax=Rhagoletis pomonella TaxID=28610 RepID=UPI00177D2BE6|nr:uncharacterized protein LOC118751298 [Rhagoletis pomonella]
MPRGISTRSQTGADAEGSKSESDDASQIGAPVRYAAQPPTNIGADALATLVASITALRECVQELRNETSRSQAEIQQLRERIELDSAQFADAPNPVAPLSVPQSSQNVRQLTLPAVQPLTSTSANAALTLFDSSAKLYPLPTFDGNAEDWPLFSANYVDTTAEFGYNNRQNLMRLQRALQGNAKRAVTSMLIYPDDVPKIIKELEFNFGRPDLLIRAQLQKVQTFPAISDNRLDQVLEFSNRVCNISAFFKSATCEHHLRNPTLLEQLITKLPPSKQFEWSKYAANVSPYPTVETFADWLSDLAKVVSIMPGVADISLRYSHPVMPQPRQNTYANRQLGQSGGSTRRVLHSSEEQPSCLCCKQVHTLTDCRKFGSLDCAAKWSFVKQHRVCFGCLQKGHSLADCRRRSTCTINGCKRMHHKLLHQDRHLPSPPADNERILNCHRDVEASLFKFLPVILIGPRGSASVYAMFDEGSSVSLLEEEVAAQLGLRGRAMPLTLQWYGDSQTTETSRSVSCEIRGVNGHNTFSVKNLCAIKGLNLPRQSFDQSKYRHLAALHVESYKNVKPVLLLGLDNCHLGVPSNTVQSREDQPVAIETKLGWVVYGPHREDFVTKPRVLQVRHSTSLNQLKKIVEDYFALENFGVNCKVVMDSEGSRRAKHILAETTRGIGKRYEIGLLWREDAVKLQISYAMAKQRLLNVESRMVRDATYAERYNNEIAKYINKGVINPHKPQKLRIVFDAAAVTNSVSLNSVLLKGPEQAQSLVTIIHKFRQGIIAVAGDIQEMFSQVHIREADQDSQRFLWREGNPNQPIRTYKMTAMIFGAICSPCCAEHIKNVNASKFQSTMSRGARAVIQNTSVDDLVVSFNSAEEAVEVTTEAVKINAAAGFKLRNFISNNEFVQQQLNGENAGVDKPIV